MIFNCVFKRLRSSSAALNCSPSSSGFAVIVASLGSLWICQLVSENSVGLLGKRRLFSWREMASASRSANTFQLCRFEV